MRTDVTSLKLAQFRILLLYRTLLAPSAIGCANVSTFGDDAGLSSDGVVRSLRD